MWTYRGRNGGRGDSVGIVLAANCIFVLTKMSAERRLFFGTISWCGLPHWQLRRGLEKTRLGLEREIYGMGFLGKSVLVLTTNWVHIKRTQYKYMAAYVLRKDDGEVWGNRESICWHNGSPAYVVAAFLGTHKHKTGRTKYTSIQSGQICLLKPTIRHHFLVETKREEWCFRLYRGRTAGAISSIYWLKYDQQRWMNNNLWWASEVRHFAQK